MYMYALTRLYYCLKVVQSATADDRCGATVVVRIDDATDYRVHIDFAYYILPLP